MTQSYQFEDINVSFASLATAMTHMNKFGGLGEGFASFETR